MITRYELSQAASHLSGKVSECYGALDSRESYMVLSFLTAEKDNHVLEETGETIFVNRNASLLKSRSVFTSWLFMAP